MRIVDLLKKDSILLNGSPASKSEAIDMLVDLQVKGGCIADREEYKKGILAREEKGSTAVGEGIAIPHAKSEAVKAPSLAAMTVPGGVDYEALDDEPSNLLFMIAAPNDGDVHLEVLSRLMTILMDEDFRERLISAKDKDEFLAVIDDMEKAKSAENAHKHGAWIGICGELAADTTLTESFLRMGIDELSVSPAFVLKVREAVRHCDLSKK